MAKYGLDVTQGEKTGQVVVATATEKKEHPKGKNIKNINNRQEHQQQGNRFTLYTLKGNYGKW